MRAEPKFGDVYLLFREVDFGRESRPGLIVITERAGARVYEGIDRALDYIRKLHDDNLKGTK